MDAYSPELVSKFTHPLYAIMFHEEENALFALEEEFENAATDPALTAGARLDAMQAILMRMQTTVLSGFRTHPQLGAHLADLALDYLAREDLAPTVVRAAFARSVPPTAIPLHGRLLEIELRRTVARIQRSAPALAH